MPQRICPICGTPFDPAFSLAMPFCSVHCQQIDLSRWLNEEYRMPLESGDGSDDDLDDDDDATL